MAAVTYECIVENGEIKLPAGIQLPEHAKVYVIVPDEQPMRVVRMMSPRVVKAEDAELLKKAVRQKGSDASTSPPPTQ